MITELTLVEPPLVVPEDPPVLLPLEAPVEPDRDNIMTIPISTSLQPCNTRQARHLLPELPPVDPDPTEGDVTEEGVVSVVVGTEGVVVVVVDEGIVVGAVVVVGEDGREVVVGVVIVDVGVVCVGASGIT